MTQRYALLAAYVVLGYTNGEIARRMGTTKYAVRDMLTKLYDRYDCRNRTELAMVCLANHIPLPYWGMRQDWRYRIED